MINNKVLIVDDDEVTLRLLKKSLDDSGFDIFVESDSKVANQLIKDNFFSLIITDINMPYINGFQLLLTIKKYSAKSKVIIISSYYNPKIDSLSGDYAVISFFKKPINLAKFKGFVTDLFDDKGFTGKVKEISIFDLLSIALLSNEPKIVSIFPEDGSAQGTIYINNEKIVHAQCIDLKRVELLSKLDSFELDKLVGLKALNKILSFTDGSISEVVWEEPEEKTLNVSYGELVNLNSINQNLNIISNNEPKILFVDDDKLFITIVSGYMVKNTIKHMTAYSVQEAKKIIKQKKISLVLTDLNMPEENGLNLIEWVNKNYPEIKIAIITGSDLINDGKVSIINQKIKYFKKPVNFENLMVYIKNINEHKGFSGSIKYIELIDYIDLLVVSYKTKLVSVIDPETGNKGLIFIKKGILIDAHFNDIRGDKAVEKILDIENGYFDEIKWFDPESRTIDQHFSYFKQKYQEKISLEEKKLNEIKSSQTIIKKEESIILRARENIKALRYLENETSNINKLTIFESGVALNIVLGKSTKEKVVSELVNFSQVKHDPYAKEQLFFYDDIGVSINFDKNNKVEEIRFSDNYLGKTAMGVKIGDKIDKALKVYGKPKVSTFKGAIWDNIAFFCKEGGVISSIRLKKGNFFENDVNRKLFNKIYDEKVDIVKLNDFTINENEGSVFELIKGKSTKKDVSEKMKVFTSFEKKNQKDNSFTYDNMGLLYFFDNLGILKEMTFYYPFEGETLKGIKIGDSIEKAIDAYGKPKYVSLQGCFWAKISVYVEDGIITSIRIN